MMELNGVPVADQTAALGVLSYGHFSTMLVDDLRVKGLDRHLERLTRDCELIFGKTLDPGRVRRLLSRVAAGCAGPAMLRATVFDTTLLSDAEPNVLVTTRPVPAPAPAALRVRTVDYARDLPTVKHLGFFGPLHQRRLAQQDGFDDALFVHRDLVCEGPTWNIAVVIGEEVIWPDDECLPGVTRALLQDVLDRAGRGWSARSVRRAELRGVRAAYVTSSGIGVREIAQIDGVRLAGDPNLLEVMWRGYAELPGDPLGVV